MKKALELIGTLLVIDGIAGIIHEFTGWFKLWVIVRYLDFLDGYEIFANIVLAVLGVVVITAANIGKRASSS
ncbi:hypothetical protein [Amycolatopsis anabasis]|uniref:hypothetical protein n=1 Tax=Amycolatopsis anabasis TaxID=1840409 RepID=UPI00131C0E3F|nr:hypothetical protein [Amycolatopsis anabasis]